MTMLAPDFLCSQHVALSSNIFKNRRDVRVTFIYYGDFLGCTPLNVKKDASLLYCPVITRINMYPIREAVREDEKEENCVRGDGENDNICYEFDCHRPLFLYGMSAPRVLDLQTRRKSHCRTMRKKHKCQLD